MSLDFAGGDTERKIEKHKKGLSLQGLAKTFMGMVIRVYGVCM